MDRQGDQLFRFGGIKRLYGDEAFIKIQKSHVLVVGLGGVGSWVVESLARSGVGHLSIVDFDDLCVSNTNRQIHALEGNIGKQKTKVLEERLKKINPYIKITVFDEPYSLDTESEIFKDSFDVVVDAIDHGLTKFQLVMACKERNTKVIVAGSAGGRVDPLQIKSSDISVTYQDKLLSILRKDLRRQGGFPRKGSMGIECVFSPERTSYADEEGCVTIDKPASFKKPLDCSTGLGTATHMTGGFGFVMSHLALQNIIGASSQK